MRFKLKSIAAALVVAAAASPAFATIDLATANVTSSTTTLYTDGGSELVFWTWDDKAGVSYTFDTGISLADFRPTSSLANANHSYKFSSLSLASSAWGSYVNAVGGDLSNSYWGIGALRNAAASSVNFSTVLATTVRDNGDLVAVDQYSSSLKNMYWSLNTTLKAGNNAGHGAGEDLTGDFAVEGANNYWGTFMQSAWAANLLLEADNRVGTQAYNFYLVEAYKKSATAQVTEYAGDWSFDGTTLSYTVAAVPEPESYALFLAGLGLMGAVARRRRIAK